MLPTHRLRVVESTSQAPEAWWWAATARQRREYWRLLDRACETYAVQLGTPWQTFLEHARDLGVPVVDALDLAHLGRESAHRAVDRAFDHLELDVRRGATGTRSRPDLKVAR